MLTISQKTFVLLADFSDMFKLAVITLSFFGMLLAGQVQAMPMPDTLAQVRRPFMFMLLGSLFMVYRLSGPYPTT